MEIRKVGVKRRFVKMVWAEGLEPIIYRFRRPMPVQLDYAQKVAGMFRTPPRVGSSGVLFDYMPH